jgi:RNA polymerase sigma-70 factor (ECF subfamily)
MVDFPKNLVVKAQKGNKKANEGLFRRVSVLSRRLLLNLHCDAQDLDDLLQECSVRILKHLQYLKKSHQFRFLVVICTEHVLIDHIRKKKRKKKIVLCPTDQFKNIAVEECNRKEFEELEQSIMNAVRKMPIEQRWVFFLVKLQEISMRKTADILQVSPSTVRNWHAKLMKRLRNVEIA